MIFAAFDDANIDTFVVKNGRMRTHFFFDTT